MAGPCAHRPGAKDPPFGKAWLYKWELTNLTVMDRTYEKSVGTALVAVGVGLLLFGFVQAYGFVEHPPTGNYPIFNLGGGSGNASVNGTFNGRFVEAFTFLGIEYLVGASILRAGWNLITPKAETIAVRVKPRSLQVEPADAPAPLPAPAPSGAGAPAAAAAPIPH